jgi:uncharacterized HAD superfamily protein
MKIGLDIDGVLAAFTPAYQQLFVETTGRDWFHVGDADDPPTWHWPQLRGYTEAETRAVWGRINSDPNFWYNLSPLPAMHTLATYYDILCDAHDVYFITNRAGVRAKEQTEAWLGLHLCYGPAPTVLLVGHRKKGDAARALELDCAIDDYAENVIDLQPHTRTYLLDRPYNRLLPGDDPRRFENIARVQSLESFLQLEGLIPYTEQVVTTP